MLHWAFDIMVGIGSAFIALGAWLAFSWWRKRDIPGQSGSCGSSRSAARPPCSTLWAGWIVTEVGRQPWIVQGFMRTSDAVTPASGLWYSFAGVLVLYAALGTIAILVLRHMARRWREGTEERGGRRPLRAAGRGRGGGQMSKADIAAVILWAGVTAYALFGGADFGGGFWDLLAGNAERGERPRVLIQHSLTPVWEANHVWLIFILVVLWTAFPKAFGAIMTTLYIPLALAAVGIVLRGAGFAFRKEIRGLGGRRAAGATFAISSVLTPFFMGTVAGAIAVGNVPASGDGDPVSSWLAPAPLFFGVHVRRHLRLPGGCVADR